MVGAWHGHGMASANQTRPHCVIQMENTHSKHLEARHGRGKTWVRHGHGMLCVNRPLGSQISRQLALEGGKIVSPKAWPPLPPRKYCLYQKILLLLISVSG